VRLLTAKTQSFYAEGAEVRVAHFVDWMESFIIISFIVRWTTCLHPTKPLAERNAWGVGGIVVLCAHFLFLPVPSAR